MHVAEEYRDDEVAVITKVHHAAIDGVSGAEATVRLLDFEAESRPGGAAGSAVGTRTGSRRSGAASATPSPS